MTKKGVLARARVKRFSVEARVLSVEFESSDGPAMALTAQEVISWRVIFHCFPFRHGWLIR